MFRGFPFHMFQEVDSIETERTLYPVVEDLVLCLRVRNHGGLVVDITTYTTVSVLLLEKVPFLGVLVRDALVIHGLVKHITGTDATEVAKAKGDSNQICPSVAVKVSELPVGGDAHLSLIPKLDEAVLKLSLVRFQLVVTIHHAFEN